VSSASLSRTELAQALRSVLLDAGEAAALDVHGRIDAAVLVPLYVSGGELHAVFTRRREDLRRHPGEISFPGGRQDDDETDLRLTALREAEEEIGLAPASVRVLGSLDRSYIPVSNFDVLPVVGVWDGRSALRPNPSEVAGILRPSLRQLADPSNHGTLPLERLVGEAALGRPPGLASPVFWVDGVVVWGFTAGLLALFLRSLGLDAPPALPRLSP
jgi:8-oxo-dGTP pyrophosphatase MutT (NUDIX family)